MPSSLDLQTLFVRLPWTVRQGLVVGQSVKNALTRYGAEYRRMKRVLSASERWHPEKLRLFQTEQLAALLREAVSGTEYYAEAFSKFSEQDLNEIARTLSVTELPILEKATLKAQTTRFFNRTRRTAVVSSTSGSTGSPLVVHYDNASVEQRFAYLHRLRASGGIGPSDRNVRLSGRQLGPSDANAGPFWMSNPFERMLLVSTYHLREPHLGPLVDKMLDFAPLSLEGYPTAIEQIARYCLEQGRVFPGIKMVVTTAETLSPTARSTIEAGFKAPVFDYYAASEGVPFICQCERGAYHVWVDSGVFEFLRPDGTPAGPGETAEIVVTSFCQWKTPLIRYRTGDLALLPKDTEVEKCPCGRAFPVVAGVLGRVEDLVITRDGRQIGMFAYRTLKHVPGLHEAQIIQRSHDSFLVRSVLDGSRPVRDVQHDLRRIFESVMGYPLIVDVEDLTAIERGPNGKFRNVIRRFDTHT